MAIKQIKTSDNFSEKGIYSYELSNSKGTSVTVLNYGAIIQNFKVYNKYQEVQDIVLGFDNVAGYLSEEYLSNYPYFGAVIGRYANRISDARFKIGSENIILAANVGKDTLHGGLHGFDKKIWNVEPIVSENQSHLTLSYLSPDGEEGFPGNVQISLTFTLDDDNALSLYYQAETDKVTALNLTHHSYFNLSTNLANIGSHIHHMHANYVLEQDANYCVTGKLLPVDQTLHDFRKPKAFNRDWDESEGYDQSYVIDKPYKSFGLASFTKENSSGLTLEVYTDQPIAHIYTAKYTDIVNGKSGMHYQPFHAFCVETQHHPNAVNIPNFPGTLLSPGTIYEQKTIYKITCQS